VLDGEGSKPPKEIEADYFSGYILAKVGASLSEAKAAMSEIASPNESHSHPARHRRLKAIEKGWLDAKGQGASTETTTETKRKERYKATFYTNQPDVRYIKVEQLADGRIEGTWYFSNGNKAKLDLAYKGEGRRSHIWHANYANNTRRVELYFLNDGRVRERDVDLRTRGSVWYNFSKH
ncbi:MAG: hypothetical protein AAF740_14220, partial [Bacteroidota bacterium]